MYRTAKACQKCKRAFYGPADCYYCAQCAKQMKFESVVKIRICQDCGISFSGGPRAKRCPNCSHIASQDTNKRHKKIGTKRPLGSTDKCAVCGEDYTVSSGRQKYCSKKCQRVGVLEWQRKNKKGYYKKYGQNEKRKVRRESQKKICVYCFRTFSSDTSSNLCSDYCRKEHKKLMQCKRDLERGYKRNLSKYEEKRNKYREMVKGDGSTVL